MEPQVNGDPRSLMVRRRWTSKDIGDSISTAEWDGVEYGKLAELGWDEDLDRYRPFLSYDDLGKVSGKPSMGFDRLITVLGLEAVTHAQTFLMEARGELAKERAAPRAKYSALIKDLETIDDDRARHALHALKTSPPNMTAVNEALVEKADTSGDSARSVLNGLASLPMPDVEVVQATAQQLSAAVEAVEQVRGTDDDEANELAGPLEVAV